MNANWRAILSQNHDSGNYYGAFVSSYKGISIKIFLFATPQLSQTQNNRIVFSRVYFRCNNTEEIENVFHDINDDIYELAKKYVKNNAKICKTYFNEYYMVNKIPSHLPFAFGDYTYVTN